MTATVHHGDCLEVMPTLEAGSVDLIVTDPPFFRVKNCAWDRQWNDADAFLAWLGRVADEWARLLAPNGSLYCFASVAMSARVETVLAERFRVLNSIRWAKPHGRSGGSCKESLRCFFPESEAIIFCEQKHSDSMAKGEAGYVAKCDELRGFVFEPLRAYLDGERVRCGLSRADCDTAWQKARGTKGCMSPHWFGSRQWGLPAIDVYLWLRSLFNAQPPGDYLRREYEDLRREYEDLRREYEDLRRPFTVSADVPYTDVWTFPTVGAYPGKHPCEKPQDMLRHMIAASSRPGALVLDCFAGSGATGRAAVALGRRFVGVEMDRHWCDVASAAVEDAATPCAQGRLL